MRERIKQAWLYVYPRHAKYIPVVLLFVMFVLFRLPALVNAGWTNSDGAVTGLQALQIARGEWTWLHWGRVYLLSLDSVMLVPFFAIFGATPVTMMSVTILGQFTSTAFAYAILHKRIGTWPAFVVVLPTVFMTMALNIYLFFAIRQWCLALVICAFWLLDGASDSKRPLLRYALGVFVGALAPFVDLYSVQFVPGLALFALLCCLDGGRNLVRWAIRGATVVSTGAVAFMVVRALERVAGVQTDRASWEVANVPHNFRLLWDTCLPWVTGYKIFAITDGWPEQKNLGPTFESIQAAGLLVFGSALLSGAALAYIPRIPWPVRRLGIMGSALGVVSLLGFLGSPTVSDIMASRMLAPVVLALPFALAPAGYLLRGWLLALALSPYLFTIMVAGWLSYGHFARGILPVGTPRGTAAEESTLGGVLREHGIKYATAHYWLSYRLTFLFKENPIVVPLDSEDRYARYKREFDAAPMVAYIFHPTSPWHSPATYEASLTATYGRVEKLEVAGFTVLVVRRAQ